MTTDFPQIATVGLVRDGVTGRTYGAVRAAAALILVLALVSGCAPVNTLRDDYAFSQGSAEGLLLASVSYHGSYSGYAMRYRKIGSKQWRELKIGSGTTLLPAGMLDWDIESPGLRGNVFAVALPAGEYEFVSWVVSSGPATVVPTEEFSIRFNVAPGAATYAGNFHFVRESSMGATVTGVNVHFQDQYDRDVQILDRKYQNVDLRMARNNVDLSEPVTKLGVGNATTVQAVIIY